MITFSRYTSSFATLVIEVKRYLEFVLEVVMCTAFTLCYGSSRHPPHLTNPFSVSYVYQVECGPRGVPDAEVLPIPLPDQHSEDPGRRGTWSSSPIREMQLVGQFMYTQQVCQSRGL